MTKEKTSFLGESRRPNAIGRIGCIRSTEFKISRGKLVVSESEHSDFGGVVTGHCVSRAASSTFVSSVLAVFFTRTAIVLLERRSEALHRYELKLTKLHGRTSRPLVA